MIRVSFLIVLMLFVTSSCMRVLVATKKTDCHGLNSIKEIGKGILDREKCTECWSLDTSVIENQFDYLYRALREIDHEKVKETLLRDSIRICDIDTLNFMVSYYENHYEANYVLDVITTRNSKVRIRPYFFETRLGGGDTYFVYKAEDTIDTYYNFLNQKKLNQYDVRGPSEYASESLIIRYSRGVFVDGFVVRWNE